MTQIYRSCRTGYFQFHFLAVDDGAVGAVLKYQNINNYYLIQFHGGKKQSSSFKKIIDGRAITIGQDNNVGYEALKWHTVQIYMIGSTFRIFINVEDEQPKVAFEGGINDEDFKEGGIGLTTFRTRAAFDSVTMKPIGDIPTEEEEKEDKVSQEIEEIKIKESGGAKK